MKISDMDAILKVIQLNGLAPAADALFLTQPALSQIILRRSDGSPTYAVIPDTEISIHAPAKERL